jgi:hypothetical protein
MIRSSSSRQKEALAIAVYSAANSFEQQKGTHIKALLGCLPFIKS